LPFLGIGYPLKSLKIGVNTTRQLSRLVLDGGRLWRDLATFPVHANPQRDLPSLLQDTSTVPLRRASGAAATYGDEQQVV
jgi:hypothetical protein